MPGNRVAIRTREGTETRCTTLLLPTSHVAIRTREGTETSNGSMDKNLFGLVAIRTREGTETSQV